MHGYLCIGKIILHYRQTTYIKNCACIASLQHPPSNLGQTSCPITELKGAHAVCFVLKLSNLPWRDIEKFEEKKAPNSKQGQTNGQKESGGNYIRRTYK